MGMTITCVFSISECVCVCETEILILSQVSLLQVCVLGWPLSIYGHLQLIDNTHTADHSLQSVPVTSCHSDSNSGRQCTGLLNYAKVPKLVKEGRLSSEVTSPEQGSEKGSCRD